MGKRHPNGRLVKGHRPYAVDEVASLFKIHRNTVRNWLKAGLKAVDTSRPTLILGWHLREFLQQRRTASRRPCGLQELFCLRCQLPRKPRSGAVAYLAFTPTLGNLVGRCEVCNLKMYRRVSFRKLSQFEGHLAVTMQQAQSRIDEMLSPSSICDFNLETKHHEKVQPCK